MWRVDGTDPEFLVHRGAEVGRTDENGWCELFHAVNSANFEMIQLLLENGADFHRKGSQEPDAR